MPPIRHLWPVGFAAPACAPLRHRNTLPLWNRICEGLSGWGQDTATVLQLINKRLRVRPVPAARIPRFTRSSIPCPPN
jgi:hypothetical protein